MNGHSAAVLHDALDRRAQHHPRAEPVRHLLAEQLRPADEAPHLGAAAGVEVALEGAGVLLVARGGDVEERRTAGRARAARRRRWAALPPGRACGTAGSRCWRGPSSRASAGPSRRRSAAFHGASTGTSVDIWSSRVDRLGDVRGERRVGWRGPERARVAVRAPHPPVVDVDVVAGVVGGELAHPELLREGEDVILRRAGEGGAALGDLTPADRPVEGPAADPASRLQHDHRAAGLDQPQRRGQSGEAGADHGHVGAAA